MYFPLSGFGTKLWLIILKQLACRIERAAEVRLRFDATTASGRKATVAAPGL